METTTLLEENMGRTVFDLNHSNIFFLDLSLKAKEVKTKINKWDLIKLKSLWTAKKPSTKQKTTYRMGEILANIKTDKELISQIYKQFIQLNIKKKNKNPQANKNKNS